MEVRCISTGRVRGKTAASGARRYLPGGWSDATLPVHAFLVDHPAGLCLFDTGQDPRAAARGFLPRWHPFLRVARFELEPDDAAAAQLLRGGVDPRAVRWVVLSHLHTDHVGGLAAFAQADVVVSRTEWRRAAGLAGRLRGYVPKQWPRGLEPTLVDVALAGAAVGPFAASHDLAGDGRLLLVPLPGHTPGHLGLLVRGDGRGALCIGDAAHTRDELALEHPDVARWCREQGIAVLAAHDDGASGDRPPV